MALGNTPTRLTNIFLEANKSFALNIRFKYHNGDPFDLTDHVLRLSADAPKHLNGDEVITLVADHVDSVDGHAQFKFQASDTNLEPAEYAMDVTLLPPNQYSIPVLKGNIIIGLNAEEINDNVFVDNVHTNEDVVVLFGTSCDVEIRFDHIELLQGQQGLKGDTGDPTALFIQPEQPPIPDAEPPVFFPLWLDTDAEYHHSGYVYEAPEPDPDMPTGVLYFDNDETNIPPNGLGVLYVKDQHGALIPVTRQGGQGIPGPPGVVIVQPEEPPTAGYVEGAMWVDEDSDVVPNENAVDLEELDARYVARVGDTTAEHLRTTSLHADNGLTMGLDEVLIAPESAGVGGTYIRSENMDLNGTEHLSLASPDMILYSENPIVVNDPSGGGDPQRITNLADPVNSTDAATKAYVDARTPPILVLSAAAPVPGGTPAGTIIVRTT